MRRQADDHERWGGSVAAWILGALPEDERQGFEDHLADCADCREQADELRVAANALPSAAAQIRPGPELRARVMSVVKAEAELLAAAGSGADRPERPPASRPRWRRSPLWRAVPAPLVAGALAVGAVVGALGASELGDGTTTRTIQAQVAPRIAGEASARLEVGGGAARLVATHLPPSPPGRVYEVWLKRAGDADPEPTTALFAVTREGDASVDVPGSLDDVERVMVTDEPKGGSKQPTGELLLTAVPA
jgi:anti-sigma-K factor RskA